MARKGRGSSSRRTGAKRDKRRRRFVIKNENKSSRRAFKGLAGKRGPVT